MSKNYAEIVKNVRAQARVFEAVIDLADELEQLGSLKNAADEASARLGGLRDEESKLAEVISGLKSEIEKLGGKKSDAAVKAKKLVEDAAVEADGIRAAAKGDAKYAIDNAKATADKIIADANKIADDIAAKIEIARAELAQINAEILAKKQESTSLQKAIEAIKKKFS